MGTAEYLENANPPWFQELKKSKQDQGRAVFLLYFNIRDVVFDSDYPPDSPDDLRPIVDFLAEALSLRDVVLYYSLHSGIEMNKGLARPLRQTFASRPPDLLWEQAAAHAAKLPFSLEPGPGRPADDPAPPHRYRVPGRAIQLLTRALTHPYTIAVPATAQDQQARGRAEMSSKPLSIGLIIDYLHHLAPGPGVFAGHAVPEIVEALQRWSTDPCLPEHNHLVIMLAPELAAVHPELHSSDSRIVSIRIPRPERDERAAFLRWLATFDRYVALREEGLVDELANRTSGMNYTELRDFVRTIALHPEQSWRELLARRRAEIIQRESGGLLVPKESPFGLNDVAGYAYVREYVDRLLTRLREGRADVTGLLFAGPPGTGKSFYASALARDAGVNVVVMRSVRNMYVGQSERNLEQVLEVARSLAPVIVFVDEIDQAFSNRRGINTDGGVEQRLLGRLLEFMDDKQNLGKVIWIAASNRPDLIDTALLSRFKLRIPFLLPDRETCRELLRHRLPRQAGFCWQADSWTDSVEQDIDRAIVGNYSGRELETIVRTALWKAEDDQTVFTDKDKPERWLRLQQEHEEKGLPPPPQPPILEGAGERAVHAYYLQQAIDSSSVGHDADEYTRQALIALQWIPFESTALIEAIKTALPGQANRILDGERINKEEISRLLKSELPVVGTWPYSPL